MVESRISRSVGAPPAPNLPSDVRAVQSLLRSVQPPLLVSVSITGTMDSNTLGAITEYQRRFMARPDGRIDPNGVTLMRMNWEPVVDQDFGTARQWLNLVVVRLGNVNDTDMKRKVRNVFDIEFDSPADADQLRILRFNYRRLLLSFLRDIPRRYYPQGNIIFQAWVDRNDQTGTIHFTRNYFNNSLERRIETTIHERSHTIFNINHSGMAGGGTIDFGHNPDDDNGLTFEEAIANAYCYGWLAAALQPGYLREAEMGLHVRITR